MKETCLGCGRFRRVIVRRKWVNICSLTGKEIPFRPCMMFVDRFGLGNKKKGDKP